MRKMYQEPAIEVVGIQMESQVLAGSPPGPSPAPGVNAGRSGYGDANSSTWGD